jgi:hypothetical protein
VGSDGGLVPTDGGGLLTASCINDGTGTIQQGGCQCGNDCYALSPQNQTLTMCSIPCDPNSSTNTCGSNGWIPNVCLPPLDICYLGCDTASFTGNDCGRSDFVCLPNSSTTTAGICLPDCNRQAPDYCASTYAYPFIACDGVAGDPDYGGCTPIGNVQGDECTGTEAYDAGEACAPVPGADASVLVTSCNGASSSPCATNDSCQSGFCDPGADGDAGTCQPCPIGYACGSSGACVLQTVANYAPCVSPAQCPATDDCFADDIATTIGATPGHCFRLCPENSCARGQSCVELQSGLSICLLPCTASTDCATEGGAGTVCSRGYCVPGSAPDGG